MKCGQCEDEITEAEARECDDCGLLCHQFCTDDHVMTDHYPSFSHVQVTDRAPSVPGTVIVAEKLQMPECRAELVVDLAELLAEAATRLINVSDDLPVRIQKALREVYIKGPLPNAAEQSEPYVWWSADGTKKGAGQKETFLDPLPSLQGMEADDLAVAQALHQKLVEILCLDDELKPEKCVPLIAEALAAYRLKT